MAGAFLSFWLLGVALSIAGIAREWRNGRRLARTISPVEDRELTEICAVLARRLGLRRVPRLFRAEGIDSPLLLGIRRPAILLPPRLLEACATAELRLMLAHELAHGKRHDLLWGWLPIGARTLYFFHPLVWPAQAEWRLAQEMAADAMAVRLTDTSAAAYGDVLLKVAAWSHGIACGGPAVVGALETPGTLARRLKAMKNLDRRRPRRYGLRSVLLGTLGLAVLIPWRLTAQAWEPGTVPVLTAAAPDNPPEGGQVPSPQGARPPGLTEWHSRPGGAMMPLVFDMKDPAKPDPRGLTMREPFTLLRAPGVREELKLTSEQQAALRPATAVWDEYVGRMHYTMRGLRRARAAHAALCARVNAVLTAAQKRQLEQISRQWWYPSALFREDVARDLSLTPDQRARLGTILDGLAPTMRGLATGIEWATAQSIEVAPGEWEEWEGQRWEYAHFSEDAVAKLRLANEDAYTRALAALTDDQRARWLELLGPPFRLDEPKASRAPRVRRGQTVTTVPGTRARPSVASEASPPVVTSMAALVPPPAAMARPAALRSTPVAPRMFLRQTRPVVPPVVPARPAGSGWTVRDPNEGEALPAAAPMAPSRSVPPRKPRSAGTPQPRPARNVPEVEVPRAAGEAPRPTVEPPSAGSGVVPPALPAPLPVPRAGSSVTPPALPRPLVEPPSSSGSSQSLPSRGIVKPAAPAAWVEITGPIVSSLSTYQGRPPSGTGPGSRRSRGRMELSWRNGPRVILPEGQNSLLVGPLDRKGRGSIPVAVQPGARVELVVPDGMGNMGIVATRLIVRGEERPSRFVAEGAIAIDWGNGFRLKSEAARVTLIGFAGPGSRGGRVIVEPLPSAPSREAPSKPEAAPPGDTPAKPKVPSSVPASPTPSVEDSPKPGSATPTSPSLPPASEGEIFEKMHLTLANSGDLVRLLGEQKLCPPGVHGILVYPLDNSLLIRGTPSAIEGVKAAIRVADVRLESRPGGRVRVALEPRRADPETLRARALRLPGAGTAVLQERAVVFEGRPEWVRRAIGLAMGTEMRAP